VIRVASLYPPATEIAFAVGAGKQLVGVSHECDFPPHVKQLNAVTAARFDPEGMSSREIYQEKVETSQKFGGLYRLSETALWELHANVLLTQGPADFSSVSLQGIRAIAEGLSPRPEVVALYPRHLDDVIEDHMRVGFAVGRTKEAKERTEQMRERIDDVASTVRLPRRPGVAFIQWLDPCFSGGYWIPQLIEIAGGIDVLNIPGVSPSPVDFTELRRQNPDVLIVACEGLSIERTRKEMSLLTRRVGWVRIAAVRTARVFIGDGAVFTRAGPRILQALRAIAWTTCPDRFPKPAPEILQPYRR